ncbi:unnamed protein product, partial [Amoebophrya sp. A25]
PEKTQEQLTTPVLYDKKVDPNAAQGNTEKSSGVAESGDAADVAVAEEIPVDVGGERAFLAQVTLDDREQNYGNKNSEKEDNGSPEAGNENEGETTEVGKGKAGVEEVARDEKNEQEVGLPLLGIRSSSVTRRSNRASIIPPDFTGFKSVAQIEMVVSALEDLEDVFANLHIQAAATEEIRRKSSKVDIAAPLPEDLRLSTTEEQSGCESKKTTPRAQHVAFPEQRLSLEEEVGTVPAEDAEADVDGPMEPPGITLVEVKTEANDMTGVKVNTEAGITAETEANDRIGERIEILNVDTAEVGENATGAETTKVGEEPQKKNSKKLEKSDVVEEAGRSIESSRPPRIQAESEESDVLDVVADGGEALADSPSSVAGRESSGRQRNPSTTGARKRSMRDLASIKKEIQGTYGDLHSQHSRPGTTRHATQPSSADANAVVMFRFSPRGGRGGIRQNASFSSSLLRKTDIDIDSLLEDDHPSFANEMSTSNEQRRSSFSLANVVDGDGRSTKESRGSTSTAVTAWDAVNMPTARSDGTAFREETGGGGRRSSVNRNDQLQEGQSRRSLSADATRKSRRVRASDVIGIPTAAGSSLRGYRNQSNALMIDTAPTPDEGEVKKRWQTSIADALCGIWDSSGDSRVNKLEDERMA